MYMDKVKNFCDHSMILWEMAANQKPTGHFWTTPASFRVKQKYFTLKMNNEVNWYGHKKSFVNKNRTFFLEI